MYIADLLLWQNRSILVIKLEPHSDKYLIHCSSGPNGSSRLAPLNLDMSACMPPVTPPPLPEPIFPGNWRLTPLEGEVRGEWLRGLGLL